MTAAQKTAMAAWLDQYAAELIGGASVFMRGSYQGFFDQHKSEIVEGMFDAAEAANPEAS